MRKMLGLFGVLIVIVACLGTCLISTSTFVTINSQSHVAYDLLGRQLSTAPWFLQMIPFFGNVWAGWFWFIVDAVIFIIIFSIGSALASWGFRGKKDE